MAFVGYRSVEDSTAAMEYFQNTYIDTSRLSIEVRWATIVLGPSCSQCCSSGRSSSSICNSSLCLLAYLVLGWV
jgi:hypothetical protein